MHLTKRVLRWDMAYVSLRLLLQPTYNSWRSVERGGNRLRGLLQYRGARQTASECAEDEWTLDLELDPEEASHAPYEEPHPQHPPTPTGTRRRTSTRGNRLLFSVGKRLLTAEEFVKKTNLYRGSSQFTAELTEDEDSVVSDIGLVATFGDKVEWWGGERELGEEAKGEKVVRSEGGGREVDVGKKSGLVHSMRLMRKFLKGKGMVGSRLAVPPTETTDLLRILEEKLDPNTKHMETFSTVPSILGSSVSEVEARVDLLRKIGFSKRETETVLLAFSSILEVDYENVYAVCEALKKCIAGGYVLRGLLMKHPFLFLQPAKQIEARAMVLKDFCQDPNALGSLFHNFPILLLTPLTPSTLQTITKYTASQHHTLPEGETHGFGHSWVAKSLYHNLSTLSARLEPGPDVPALIDLLAEFQLDPAPILVKFPGFFKATYAHVASLVDVLTGSPLYLDTVSIRTLLCSVPDQLVWSEDAEHLLTHLMTLTSLFTSVKECSEKVVTYPGLVLPQMDLNRWLVELEDLGFTVKEIGILVSGTPNILLQNREEEVIPLVKFLLAVPGTSPSSITSCPINCRVDILSTPLDVLTVRLNYALQHKPEMVSGQHLAKIFASQGKDFAAFCGRSVEQLHSETGLSGIELKKFKSRQKSTRKSPILESLDVPPHSTVTSHDSCSEVNLEKAEDAKSSKTLFMSTKKIKQSGQKKKHQKEKHEDISGSALLSRTVGSDASGSNIASKCTLSNVGKKGSNETKKLARNRASKEEKSPRPDARTESVSTSSMSAYGAKPLHKQKTTKSPKTNSTATTQRKKSYSKELA